MLPLVCTIRLGNPRLYFRLVGEDGEQVRLLDAKGQAVTHPRLFVHELPSGLDADLLFRTEKTLMNAPTCKHMRALQEAEDAYVKKPTTDTHAALKFAVEDCCVGRG